MGSVSGICAAGSIVHLPWSVAIGARVLDVVTGSPTPSRMPCGPRLLDGGTVRPFDWARDPICTLSSGWSWSGAAIDASSYFSQSAWSWSGGVSVAAPYGFGGAWSWTGNAESFAHSWGLGGSCAGTDSSAGSHPVAEGCAPSLEGAC